MTTGAIATADVCTEPGAVYEAADGSRYRVLHTQRDGCISLLNLARPSSCYTPTLAELARGDLRLVERPAPKSASGPADANVAAAENAPEASPTANDGADQPAPPPYVPYWTPPPRREVPTTLGAQRPTVGDRRMPMGPAPYWMPCSKRYTYPVDGVAVTEPHVWFLSDGAQIYCPTCRGEDAFAERGPAVRWCEDPPAAGPPSAAAIAAIGKLDLGVRWWAMVLDVGHRDVKPANMSPEQDADLEQLDQVVEIAPAKPEPCCADCGVSPRGRAGIALWYQDDGITAFCSACLRRSTHVMERLALSEPPRRPPPTEPAPRPALAPKRTRQDEWRSITAELDL